MHGDFDIPTRVVFGAGRVRELPDLLSGWGEQALIVTDPGVRRNGIAQPVLDALAASELDFRVFDDLDSSADIESVEAGLRRFEGCDFLLAVGGGGPMDVAKAIRLRAAQDAPLTATDDEGNGSAALARSLPPLACVPTTAGTGSEVARSATITITGRKTPLAGPHLLPDLALCDPEMTRDLPAGLTASTGATAILHNLGSYFSPTFHPVCDALALEGLRRAVRALPTAVRDGLDLQARGEMMLAAMMGGIALRKGLGAIRALSHALSNVAGVRYGTAGALLLPHYLRFNREAIAERAGAAAEVLGVAKGDAPEEAVDRVAAALEGFFAGIGLPSHLREVNVTSALVRTMAEVAMEDAAVQHNPRPVTEKDLEALLQAAL